MEAERIRLISRLLSARGGFEPSIAHSRICSGFVSLADRPV
jgi:hypothetical protein